MKVGFTGTRDGMTDEQRRAFIRWVKTAGVTEFHYGVCIGADEDAWDVMVSGPDLGFTRPRTVAHPPSNLVLASQSTMMFDDEIRPTVPYAVRNQNIVDASELLLATPKQEEELRSGTWLTIRYARKKKKPIVIFWPDGTITHESETIRRADVLALEKRAPGRPPKGASK